MLNNCEKNECLTFLETGLNALEKIDWYGETEFTSYMWI